MKSEEREEIIQKNISDIQRIFPYQLVLTQKQLALLRKTSVLTLKRERDRAEGVPFKERRGKIEYPVREVAVWLADTVTTT